MRADRYEEAADSVRDGLALARRVGNRYWESCCSASPIRRSLSVAGTRCWRRRRRAARGAVDRAAGTLSASSLLLALSSTSTAAPTRRRAGSSSLRGARDLLRHPGARRHLRCGNRVCFWRAGMPPMPCASPRSPSGPQHDGCHDRVREGSIRGRGRGSAGAERSRQGRGAHRSRRRPSARTVSAVRCVRSRRASRRGWRAIQRMRSVISRARPVSSASSLCLSTLRSTELEHAEWLVAQSRVRGGGATARRGSRDLRAARSNAVARAACRDGHRTACRGERLAARS